MFSNLSTGGKIAAWLTIAFVVFYVLSSPKDAGKSVHSGLDGLQKAANQVATFVKSISN